MNRILLTIAATVIATSAIAAEAPKGPLTNGQALDLLGALRVLDQPHEVVVKNGGTSSVARVPWEFSNPTLRMRIKRNIQALEPIWKNIMQTRADTEQELLKTMKPNAEGKVPTKVEDSPEASLSFRRQMDDLLAKPVDGVVDLGRIRASELNLKVNDISLSGLDPILDDDVTTKDGK